MIRSNKPAKPKVAKQVKCQSCAEPFFRSRALQRACSPSCAQRMVEKKKAQEGAKAATVDRVKTKARLREMEGMPKLLKRAETAFNKFIRVRDKNKPCISCGKPLGGQAVGGYFDCGHYRSVGSAPHMRFVEDNAHGQCKNCNRHLAGNHVEYRKGLVKRIGQKSVESIESDQTLRRYSREGVREIERHYAEASKGVEVPWVEGEFIPDEESTTRILDGLENNPEGG